MTGVPQLREALELWESYLAGIHDCNLEEPEAVAVLHINAAARRLVEVAETSQEPDYEAAAREMAADDGYDWDELSPAARESLVLRASEYVHAAVGGRRLVDPQLLPGDDDEND